MSGGRGSETWQLLEAALRAAGTRDVIVTADRRVPAPELLSAVGARARILLEAAGAARRRVVLSVDDPLDMITDVLACWARDLVPVLVRERSPAAAVEALADAVGAAAMRHDATLIGRQNPRRAPDPAEALVLTTSGTSGVPKLVALPHASVRLNVQSISAALALSRGDRVLVAQPLSHVYGLVGGCLLALLGGAEAHLFDSRAASPILQAHIRKAAITIVQGAPTFWRLFLSFWRGEPFESVRVWTTASEAPGRTLIDRVGEALPRARGLLGFGMTEAGPRVSHVDVADPAVDDGCIGAPFAHIEWRVDAPDAQGVGPLALRGPSMFLGYIPAGTAPPGGAPYGGYSDDGWFVTSDRVAVGADGRLRYRGRTDTAVKVGDHLVNPMVVEQAALTIAGVLDARCVAEPHPVLGHTLTLELLPDVGVSLDVDAVRRACQETLDPWLVPRTIRVVDALPRTAAGKRSR